MSLHRATGVLLPATPPAARANAARERVAQPKKVRARSPKPARARATLRAELDGLVAHLYGLTADKFAYILTTFPLVAQPVKDAALETFHTFQPKPGHPEIAAG